MRRRVLALNVLRAASVLLLLPGLSNCAKPSTHEAARPRISVQLFNRAHIQLTSMESRHAQATWAHHVADGGTDPDGHKQLTAGSWNSDSNLTIQGGQVMNFALTDVNALPTTITITASDGESHNLNLLPSATQYMKFTRFGAEPMGWSFDISTSSDAFIVNYILYSSWIPGDPNNG